MSNTGNWMHLDELENSIDNLERCAQFLAEIAHPTRWKWSIIALHQALYGFAICAIRGTSSSSVLRNPEKWDSQLIAIWTALDRAKLPDHLWPGAHPLVVSADEKQALDRLVSEFRNQFEHFGAVAWSIEVSGMPELFGHTLRVLRHLACNSGSVRYYEDVQEDRVIAALGRIDELLRGTAA